jgi:hypothetical protein
MTASADFFPRTPLWTPEIQRVAAIVAEWIINDLPGGHVWGLQRIGKSDFAKFLKQALPAILGGDIATIIWDFADFTPSNSDTLVQRCLIGSGCAAISARGRAALQMRLVQVVIDLCRAAGATRVVVIVDEIQNVPPALYPIFMSIMSDLTHAGLLPHLLSIGQPEMAQSVKLMHDNHQLQTIGRFFPRVENYYALAVPQVQEMLVNMDSPEGAFSKQWFVHRAESGWRVGDLAEPIDQALAILAGEQNLTAKPRLPLGWLRPALNATFRQLSTDAKALPSGALINQCFKAVGFDTVAHYYVD